MKKLALFLATLLLVLSFTSCSVLAEATRLYEQEYTVKDDMRITLSGLFTQQDALFEGYTALFVSMDSMVLVIDREVENTSAYAYAIEMAAGVGLSMTDVEMFRPDCARYTYETNLLGKDFAGVCYVYYNDGTIWMVEMICEPDAFDGLESEFEYWARSVCFSEPY